MELTDHIRAAIHKQLVAKPSPRKRRERRVGTGLWYKPFVSDALGVGTGQINKAREHLHRHGITAEFDSEGRCIVTSDKQYRDVARATGMYDGRDGWDVKNNEGFIMETGRTPEREKEKFKQMLEKTEDW